LSGLLSVRAKQGAVADPRGATGCQPEANWAAAGRAVPNRPDNRMPALCSLTGVEPQLLFWVLWTPHFFAEPS